MSSRHTLAGRPCAECRRLKHKCDRQLPCSNCVKKGCGDICPEGTNATGEGHKRFWERTRELRDTLGDLAGRIAALELALQASHAITSSLLHPLLEEDMLKIKEPYLRAPSPISPISQPIPTTGSSSPREPTDTSSASVSSSTTKSDTCTGVVEALGSLSINRNGRTKYFGPAALASCFLANEQPMIPGVKLDMILNLLPPDVGMIASAFPMSLLYDREDGRADRLATLRCFLPPVEEAMRYKSLYYQHATFVTCPVPEQELQEVIWPIVYAQPWPPEGEDDHRAHHCLSVAFLICAIGAMVDPRLSPRNSEGAKYYELACASLFGSRVVEDPTIEAVQALCLIARYLAFARKSIESNTYRIEWAMVGLAIKVAQTMGLHRDPGSFDLPPNEVERRRRLWWDLYGHDAWNSMRWSLPPALSSQYFDTKMPHINNEVGTNITSAWRWSYCVECVEPMQQQIIAVARPTHEAIMELDRKLRTHPIPQSLLFRPITVDDLAPEKSMKTLQRSLSTMYRDICLVLLHRNHCDRATDEQPSDPLNHLYGASVIAVYRSAWAVLAVAGMTYDHMPHPSTRISCLTHLVFTAVAALCSIITRCPTLTLVPDALLQLDKFYGIARRYHSAEPTFQTISDLREAAHATYIDRVIGANPAADGETWRCQSASDVDRREAMLAQLGGKTRRIDCSNMPNVPSSAKIVLAPLQLPTEELHPHVMEYLQRLDMSEMWPSR